MPEMQVRSLGLEYSPGGGNGKLLQYSCLGNPTDEEPGRLQSTESQRVQQDSETKPTAIIYVCMCLIYDIFYIPFMCTCVYSVAQLHLTLQRHRLEPTRLLCPRNFSGKNTGVGCHFLPKGIFLTQGWNPRLLHWQADSIPLNHFGNPYIRIYSHTNTKYAKGFNFTI